MNPRFTYAAWVLTALCVLLSAVGRSEGALLYMQVGHHACFDNDCPALHPGYHTNNIEADCSAFSVIAPGLPNAGYSQSDYSVTDSPQYQVRLYGVLTPHCDGHYFTLDTHYERLGGCEGDSGPRFLVDEGVYVTPEPYLGTFCEQVAQSPCGCNNFGNDAFYQMLYDTGLWDELATQNASMHVFMSDGRFAGTVNAAQFGTYGFACDGDFGFITREVLPGDPDGTDGTGDKLHFGINFESGFDWDLLCTYDPGPIPPGPDPGPDPEPDPGPDPEPAPTPPVPCPGDDPGCNEPPDHPGPEPGPNPFPSPPEDPAPDPGPDPGPQPGPPSPIPPPTPGPSPVPIPPPYPTPPVPPSPEPNPSPDPGCVPVSCGEGQQFSYSVCGCIPQSECEGEHECGPDEEWSVEACRCLPRSGESPSCMPPWSTVDSNLNPMCLPGGNDCGTPEECGGDGCRHYSICECSECATGENNRNGESAWACAWIWYDNAGTNCQHCTGGPAWRAVSYRIASVGDGAVKFEQKSMDCIPDDVGGLLVSDYLSPMVCKNRPNFPPFPDECGVLYYKPGAAGCGYPNFDIPNERSSVCDLNFAQPQTGSIYNRKWYGYMWDEGRWKICVSEPCVGQVPFLQEGMACLDRDNLPAPVPAYLETMVCDFRDNRPAFPESCSQPAYARGRKIVSPNDSEQITELGNRAIVFYDPTGGTGGGASGTVKVDWSNQNVPPPPSETTFDSIGQMVEEIAKQSTDRAAASYTYQMFGQGFRDWGNTMATAYSNAPVGGSGALATRWTWRINHGVGGAGAHVDIVMSQWFPGGGGSSSYWPSGVCTMVSTVIRLLAGFYVCMIVWSWFRPSAALPNQVGTGTGGD